MRWPPCALLILAGISSSAQAYDQPPPEGVVAPPYERPVKRPMVQAALIAQGTVQSIHLQPNPAIPVATMTWQDGEWRPAGIEELPLTDAFQAYVADRFAGYPEPEWMGRWGFQVLRVEVDEVIASESGVDVKAGDVFDLYVPSDLAIHGPRLIAFAELYVRKHEGTVSPWSEPGKAFVLPETDVSSSLIFDAPQGEECPSAALSVGGYIIDVGASKSDIERLAALVPGTTVDDDAMCNVAACGTVGGVLTTPRRTLEGSALSCSDVAAFSSVPAAVRRAR